MTFHNSSPNLSEKSDRGYYVYQMDYQYHFFIRG